MPWFRLDDSFDTHPKVIAAGNEATGLFVRCGTYCARHLTDGFIPEHVALLYGSPELVESLVRAKLWRRVRGGWRMPDYLDYNPSAEQVKKERKAAAERQRRHRKESSEKGQRVWRDSPVDNHRETDNSTSEQVTSHRDSRRDSRPPVPYRPVPDPVVDVVNLTNGHSEARASPETIEAIMSQIHETTGRHITEEWAHRVADHLLAGRSTASPAAYCRQAIRNDPDPRKRFLPLY